MTTRCSGKHPSRGLPIAVSTDRVPTRDHDLLPQKLHVEKTGLPCIRLESRVSCFAHVSRSDKDEPRGDTCIVPTSAPRNAQEKWFISARDRNFINAWGDSSPLELGRVMPNECWQGCEAPLANASVGVPQTKAPSSVFGTMRRDPQEETLRAEGDIIGSTSPALEEIEKPNPQGAFAMGQPCGDTSKRSLKDHVGTPLRTGRSVAIVAPFGVHTHPRVAHTTEDSARATITPTKGRTGPDGVDRSESEVPHSAVGDGCPDAVFFESAARSGQRGKWMATIITSLESLSLEEALAYLDSAEGDELSAAFSLARDRNLLDGDESEPDEAEVHHALFLLRRARGLNAPSFDLMRVQLRRLVAA